MKNSKIIGIPLSKGLSQLMRIMKLSCIILMFTILNAGATVYSQTTRLNAQMTDVTVKEVFKRIEDQSKFRFFYSGDLNYINKKVNINATDKTVEKILDEILEDSDLTYKILENDLIIIVPADMMQGITVTGVIKDEKGEPVPGVSVIVKGTANGSVTDVKGKYTISAPNKNAVLVFTFIGYESQEITVGDQRTIDVEMKESTTDLGEVVVTALGVKREYKSVGYAISSIKGEDMLKAGVTANPLTTLYGKAAGVGIEQGVAGPTGGVNIKIRGAARLDPNSKTRPLFVVDGVPIYDKESSMANRNYDPLNSFDYGAGINDLNPEDIESMDILKGSKAAALYGSEGANGVILITTKKGAGTRGLGVQLSYQHTFEQPINYIDFQNEYGTGSSQYSETTATNNAGEVVRRLRSDRYCFGPKFDGKPIMDIDGNMIPYQAYPDNFNSWFRNGHSDNISVAISGGNEKGNMRAAYTNYNYQSILDNFWQKKNTLSFSGQMNASKFAKFEINANMFDIKTHNRYPNIGSLVAWGLNRDQPYETLERFYLDETGYKRNQDGLNASYFANNMMNLLWQQNQNNNTDDKFHLIGSIRGTFQFHPNVFLVTAAGIDYTQIEYTRQDRVTRITPTMQGGKYGFTTENNMIQNYEASLNYDKTFENELRVFAMGGAQYRINSNNSTYVGTYGDMPYPDWYSIKNENKWPSGDEKGKVRDNSFGSDILYGVYGNATISWKDKYFLDITARNDWSSTLPPGNNSYFYPGVSLTWNFDQDITIPYLQSGKLRFAWANVGTPATRYYAFQSYSMEPITGSSAYATSPPGSLFSGAMKPERKKEYEIGFDTRFFERNRLEASFSFYTNHIYDQIMAVDLTPSSGYGTIKINAGDVKNWGYELFLKGAPVATNDYRWDITFTTSNQYSKVESLYTGINKKVIESANGFQVVAMEGQKMGDLMTYDYLRDSNGNRVVNSTDGIYQLDYKKGFVKNSNVNPTFYGGLMSDFYYKNFNIHVGFDYKFGARLVSMSNYYLYGNGVVNETLKYRDEEHGGMAYYLDADKKKIKWEHNQPAPAASSDGHVYHDGLILPGVIDKGEGQYVENDKMISATEYWTTYIHDMNGDLQPDYIFKNDYIKFREISISYTLPLRISSLLKLQKLTVSLMARNLFYIYKTLPNVDTESALGTNTYMEYSFFPTARSYGIGVNVSF